jgi:HD-like signal output (HDOD) protein
LKLWGLPHEIINAVAFFSDPFSSSNPKFGPLTCVHASYAVMLKNETREPFLYENFINIEYLKKIGKFERLTLWSESCNKSFNAGALI